MVDFLTQREADYCQNLLDEFKDNGTLPALVAAVEAGGLTTANLPFLFELRFAKALIGSGVNPTYERVTVDNTSVDFTYQRGDSTVLTELVSITTSAAVIEATQHEVDENGIAWATLILTTARQDPRFSEEGEVLLVQQKICEKVFRDGRAVKFPVPDADYHVIVVDMRGFLGGNGGDNADCVQLTLGNGQVGAFMRRYWTNPATNVRTPILGLFEDTHRPRGAPTLRQRVHGILFLRDTGYVDGSLLAQPFLVCNPNLIASDEEAAKLRAAVLG